MTAPPAPGDRDDESLAARFPGRGIELRSAAAVVRPPSLGRRLAALPQRIAAARGWRRRAIALICGAAGAAAMPPFDVFPAIAAPMTVAVWLIDGADDPARTGRDRLWAAFGAGWWLGLGYFLAGLWWIGAACLVDGLTFLWALPLAVLALPIALAVFPGLGFALAARLWSPGPLRIFALAFGLGVAEWARGLLFTGFPWNDLGMTLGAIPPLAQIASLIGLHGLTFLAVAVFSAPAALWSPRPRDASAAAPIAAALALLGIAAYGVVRLAAPPSPTVPGVKLRLMQPNVAQGPSFAPEHKDAILRRYLDLSARDGSLARDGVGVTHLIWPES